MSPSASPPRYRWVVLAVGSLATAALAAVQGGLPALGPAIQEAFGLSLVEVTAVFTAFAIGTVATLLAWGVLSDRVGERFVIAGGLMAGALAMVGAAASDGYVELLASMTLSGMLGASAIAASGRAVFGWFPRDERGLALGLRQTAVPVGAAAASFSLPPLASGTGVDGALYALAGVMALAAVAAAVWLREGPRVESAAPPAPDAARDPRIWRLSAASSLMIIGQVGITSLLVLYLYGERDWSAHDAAIALGVVQVGAAVARASAGRWSDLRDERIEPFRRLAALAGVLLLAAAAAGPIAVPLLMAGGVAAMSWNGLSFTAAAEISGRRQAGKAMGIQNTAMRVVAAGVPVSLAALASAVSWPAAFVVMGVTPLLARALLGPLVQDERRRRLEREARLESRRHAGGTTSVDAVGP
ncbi:MAG TPA: MFS transporter [Thermoleophilaceae bacterium]|nr:MFS transporter [Thermoleophilaceae bacterium]